MLPALPDTDILSLFFRNNPTVIDRAADYLNVYLCLQFSVISYYEILNGLLYKDARKQLQAFAEFTKINQVLLLNAPAAGKAAEIYAELKRQEKPIGQTYSLIAGIAMVNNLQLITNNTKHFERVKDISIANWML